MDLAIQQDHWGRSVGHLVGFLYRMRGGPHHHEHRLEFQMIPMGPMISWQQENGLSRWNGPWTGRRISPQ